MGTPHASVTHFEIWSSKCVFLSEKACKIRAKCCGFQLGRAPIDEGLKALSFMGKYGTHAQSWTKWALAVFLHRAQQGWNRVGWKLCFLFYFWYGKFGFSTKQLQGGGGGNKGLVSGKTECTKSVINKWSSIQICWFWNPAFWVLSLLVGRACQQDDLLYDTLGHAATVTCHLHSPGETAVHHGRCSQAESLACWREGEHEIYKLQLSYIIFVLKCLTYWPTNSRTRTQWVHLHVH